MALTTGFVQKLTCLAGPNTCAWVGDSPASNELLTISSSASETDVDRANKRRMTAVLALAMTGGKLVEVTHPEDSGTVTSVNLPGGNTSSRPLQLDGIEVTQGIQDLSHSVPLIAEKRTVVRVYLSHYGVSPISVSGQLALRRGPNAAPIAVTSANTVTLSPASAGNLVATRNDVIRSLNFVLPAGTTDAGELSIRVARVSDTGTGAAVPLGNEVRPTVNFQPSPPLRVRVIRITYPFNSPPVTQALLTA